jgi:hypothetical protein
MKNSHVWTEIASNLILLLGNFGIFSQMSKCFPNLVTLATILPPPYSFVRLRLAISVDLAHSAIPLSVYASYVYFGHL